MSSSIKDKTENTKLTQESYVEQVCNSEKYNT